MDGKKIWVGKKFVQKDMGRKSLRPKKKLGLKKCCPEINLGQKILGKEKFGQTNLDLTNFGSKKSLAENNVG